MKKHTVREAAKLVGVSASRIRQLCLGREIDFEYFGNLLVITDEGVRQARNRKKKPGPAPIRSIRKAA